MSLIPGIGVFGLIGIKMPVLLPNPVFSQVPEGYYMSYAVGDSNLSVYIGHVLGSEVNPTYENCIDKGRYLRQLSLGENYTMSFMSSNILTPGTYYIRTYYEFDGVKFYSDNYPVTVKEWPDPVISLLLNGSEVFVSYSMTDNGNMLGGVWNWSLEYQTFDGTTYKNGYADYGDRDANNVIYTYTYQIPAGETLIYLKGKITYSVNGSTYTYTQTFNG